MRDRRSAEMSEDEENLRLLSIFHYVVAGIAAIFSCFPIVHVVVGVAVLTGNLDDGSTTDDASSVVFGLMFVLIPAFIILLGWAFAACIAISGRYIVQKRRYLFCLVIAALSCLFMPLGTILGVFTIIVLMRPSVKELFAQQLLNTPGVQQTPDL